MPDQTLAQRIKAKYPGQYDDLGDQELEAKIVAKYPGVYDDLPKTAATHKTQNDVDDAGNPLVRFGSALIDTINPINQVKALYQQVRHPIDSARARQQQWEQDPFTMALAESPLGIMGGASAGKRIGSGDVAGGLGEGLGNIVNAAAPVLIPRMGGAVRAGVGGVRRAAGGLVERAAGNLTPVEAQAVQFGRTQGIPIDAATATNSPLVRNVQKAQGERFGGATTAQRFKTAQAENLERVGGELATDVHPSPATPESAGQSVQSGVQSAVKMFDDQANQAYGTLRAIEAASPTEVPATRSPREVAVERQQIAERQQASVGHVSEVELREIRRIKAELDHLPFVSRTWNSLEGERGVRGNAAGGHAQITPGAAGAPVYDDILQHAPGSFSMTRNEMRRALESALETGHFTNAAKGALEVARKRLAGGTGVSRPSLPPEAGDVAASTQTKSMLLPVDLRETKTDIAPIYQRLKREAELVPLQGDKARALTALDRLINGPDFAPVTVVDAALGDLKAMARGALMPELRTQGQGLAAGTVKKLDAAVRQAVAAAGPEAVRALEDGRAATTAKYAVAEVLDTIRAEPVQAYRQAIAPKDTAVAKLRQVQDITPNAMPEIGRAVLDELLAKATAEGGFQKAAGLWADWQRLGPQTKRILFGTPARVQQLDQFFLLAKKIGENPNPSGTAGVVAAGQMANPLRWIGLVPTWAMAKILYSDPAAISRASAIAAGPGRVSQAVSAAAVANLVRAAQKAGVVLPQAAQTDDQGPP